MTPWRTLHQQLRQFTYVTDIMAYADVFDAIDEAIARGSGYQPGPSEYESLGKVQMTDRDGHQRFGDFVVARTPVTQVRVAHTVRLCIGLLQSSLWYDTQRWHLGGSFGHGVLLPSVATLLARKLQPTLTELADLAKFLILPAPGMSRDEQSFCEPLSHVFRFLEKHVTPPAGEPLRAALLESRRRIALAKSQAMQIRGMSGGKPSTARFDKWDARVAQLLG